VPLSLTIVGLLIWATVANLSDSLGQIDGAGFWYLVAFGLVVTFTLVGFLGWVRGRQGKPVQLIRPFAEVRRDRYFAYVRRLLAEPSFQSGKLKRELAQRTLRAKGGSLRSRTSHTSIEAEPFTLKDRMLLEQRIEVAIQTERSYKTQAKEIMRSMVSADRDAFYYPSRMYAAFVISVFSTTFMARKFFLAADALVQRTQQLDDQQIQQMMSVRTTLQDSYRSLMRVDLPGVVSRFIDRNADQLHEWIVSLAQALRTASVVGSALGISFYIIAWVVLCLDFRAQVLQARRGVWQFNVQKVAIGTAFTYIGTQVSNGLLTYVIVSYFFSFWIVLFAWNLTWDLLLWWLRNNVSLLLAIIIPMLIDMLITKIFLMNVTTPKWIKNRYLWAAFDLYKILAQVVAGLVKALVRFALVVLVTLFSLPRIDRSPFPAWLEMYLLLDTGSKSYQGVILLYHSYNNPVFRVACWLLQEDAANRADPETAARLGLCSTTRRRISNRWYKAWIMYKNPVIASYSSSGEKGVELKELKKAAAEIEKEERERLAKLQRERGQLRNALAPSFLVGKNGGEQGKGVMMANEV